MAVGQEVLTKPFLGLQTVFAKEGMRGWARRSGEVVQGDSAGFFAGGS